MNVLPNDFVLVQRIQDVQQGGLLSLERLARRLRMSPPALLGRLRRLRVAGWVERREVITARGRVVHYVPAARVAVQYVSPRAGVAFSWSAAGEVDWDFPLLSRVPDAPARESLKRFLLELRRRNLLDGTATRDGAAVVLYGSTARGTARPDSDCDVLVVVPERKGRKGGDVGLVEDAAATASLEGPRAVQAHAVKPGELTSLPREIRSALKMDGIIVHDALHLPDLWRAVRRE